MKLSPRREVKHQSHLSIESLPLSSKSIHTDTTMAPNITPGSTQVETFERLGNDYNNNSKERQEILCNGYYYDVTDFIDRHPGGDVIRFYTEPGEDASEAIEQFHFRSKAKVQAMLRSFKRRPALPHERGKDRKVLTRHEALSADFKKLHEELFAEGYFEPSIRHVILRLLECSVVTLLGLALFLSSDRVFTKTIGTVIFSFGLSRFGWLQHEGGHRSLTGNSKIDQAIQDFSLCLVIGGSSRWWNSSHLKHHAMPQRLHHDVDLETLPFVAFHKKLVNGKCGYNSFFVKYQHILFTTLDMLLIGVALKWYIQPLHQLRSKAYSEMLLSLPANLLILYFAPLQYYLLASYLFSVFMACNLFLNHTHLEVTDHPTHWVEYSLTHTANITPSICVDFWMAYLNYQIEHHLFPTMPQFRHKEICHRVKALADKHGLPYRVFSYPQAFKLAMKNLSDVGNEITKHD